MKNTFTKLLSLALVVILCLGTLTACPGGGKNDEEIKDIEDIVTDEPDDLKGLDFDGKTIWVGNTAATTGAMAGVGEPFNLGLQAAFEAYNKAGGYNGMSIKLKHYDDGGEADKASTLMDKLIQEDEIFAVVGHFGSYAVDATIDTLIDEQVPMIYAAAGNNELFNANATTLGEKGIIPVQPLNETEGRMLILRAFAPADKGGLAAQKVGVIYNSNEASKALYSGIQKEMANLPDAQRNSIITQEVNTGDYSAAVNNLKAEGCDVVILTVIGDDFFNALSTMANVNYVCSVLTTYNNASAAKFNDGNSKLQPQYEAIFQTVTLFAQAWLDITNAEYYYHNTDAPLYKAYKGLALVYAKDPETGKNVEVGVGGFTPEYWTVAENIYNYVLTVDKAKAFAMSYDAYALAGYIAGDLFCQAMEALEKSGMALSRANLVYILESQDFQVAMANKLSFANGVRSGVQDFALTWIFDSYNLPEGAGKTSDHVAASATVFGLMSIEDYRALLKE